MLLFERFQRALRRYLGRGRDDIEFDHVFRAEGDQDEYCDRPGDCVGRRYTFVR